MKINFFFGGEIPTEDPGASHISDATRHIPQKLGADLETVGIHPVLNRSR